MDYHMRRQEKQIKDLGEVYAILDRGKFITLALCRGGEPYVVTMNYGFGAAQRELYFHCAFQGEKLDILRENNRVCGTVIEDLGYQPGDCDHWYRSIVIRGKMDIIEDRREKIRCMDVMLDQLEPDGDKIRKRKLLKPGTYDGFCMLRLKIDSVDAKCSHD